MKGILEFLSGKKTYILAAGALAVIACWMGGLIGDDIANQALVALGFGTVITLRAAITKGG
jgi:hypothetical protein